MNYAVVIGSDMFIGTSGVVRYKDEGGNLKEFFRIRELFRERSEGSYLTVDVDIKDSEGTRVVKLAKSRSVVESPGITIKSDKNRTTVMRDDGDIVIDVEQLKPDDPSLPQTGFIKDRLQAGDLDTVLRITGNFKVGNYQLKVSTKGIEIGGILFSENLSEGAGGLVLTPMGISF